MKRGAVYLFLCGVYLLYWSHAEYFADDWILMPLFRKASAGGAAGVWDLAVRAAENRIYEVFRMQWLSILFGYGVTWIGKYTPQVNFAMVLLLHLANAGLLCRALGRWGVDRGLAWLAGALFLVLPTSRFVLFTYFTNPFFVFAAFWVLLLLGERRWRLAAVLAVAGMFAGEQVFALLALGIPLAAVCLSGWRRAVPTTAAVWGAMGVAGGVYLGWINVQSPGEARRYEWVWRTFWNNVNLICQGWWNLTGLPADAPFRVTLTVAGVTLAVGAALLAAAVLRRAEKEGGAVSLGRVALFGAGGAVLGYGPTLWLAAGYPLRYHYVPTPFLAVLLAAGCWALGRRAALVSGGLLVGFFTLNAASEIRQCWIPAAERQRALEAEVRRLRGVEAGDFVAVIGEPFEFGTAQHFSLHSAETAGPFVEWATGVGPVTVARGLVYRPPGLALFLKWNHWRPLTDADLRRTHLLVRSRHGVFERPEWVAQDIGRGRFRALPLKGTADPGGVARAVLTREQLVLLGRRVYFP